MLLSRHASISDSVSLHALPFAPHYQITSGKASESQLEKPTCVLDMVLRNWGIILKCHQSGAVALLLFCAPLSALPVLYLSLSRSEESVDERFWNRTDLAAGLKEVLKSY